MNDLKNIIAFCILMENNNGILEKSPDYIMEKFNRYISHILKGEQLDTYKWGLDATNRKKLNDYFNKWK